MGPPRSLQEEPKWKALGFHTFGPRMSECVCAALSPPVCGGLLWWPQETNTVTQLAGGKARVPRWPGSQAVPCPWPHWMVSTDPQSPRTCARGGAADLQRQSAALGWVVSPAWTEG